MIHQTIDNHIWDFGSLDISRRKFMYLDLGLLGTRIIDAMLDVPSIVSLPKFSLVHIIAPRKKFSVGVLTHVPEKVIPLDTQLAFTFVIDGKVNRTDTPKENRRPPRLFRRKRHLTQWNGEWVTQETNTGHTFLTILFRTAELQNTGVTHTVNMPMLFHLYEAIGLITNNWIRHKERFNYNQNTWDNYDRYYRTKNLSVLHHDNAGGLRKLTRQVPFHHWTFNRYIWKYHPNLIPPQSLSHYSVYFYLKHFHKDLRKTLVSYRSNFRQQVAKKVGFLEGNGGMLDILLESAAHGPHTLETESWEEITEKKAAASLLGPFEHADPEEVYNRLWLQS